MPAVVASELPTPDSTSQKLRGLFAAAISADLNGCDALVSALERITLCSFTPQQYVDKVLIIERHVAAAQEKVAGHFSQLERFARIITVFRDPTLIALAEEYVARAEVSRLDIPCVSVHNPYAVYCELIESSGGSGYADRGGITAPELKKYLELRDRVRLLLAHPSVRALELTDQIPLGDLGDDLLRLYRAEPRGRQQLAFRRIFAAGLRDLRSGGDIDLITHVMEVCEYYSQQHELDPRVASRTFARLIACIDDANSEVALLFSDNGYEFSPVPGAFGLGDYYFASVQLDWSPRSLTFLGCALKTVAGTTPERHETLRRLASASMEWPFGPKGLKERIHDNFPDAAPLIDCMVRFYDTGDSAPLCSLLTSRNLPVAPFVNRAEYDREVESDELFRTVSGIALLREMQRVVSSVHEERITVSDPAFEVPLAELEETFNSPRASWSVLSAQLGRLTDAIAHKCSHTPTELIPPSTAVALSWLESKLRALVREVTFEQQIGLLQSPLMREILRFQEFTANADHSFDQDRFNAMWQEIQESDWESAGFVIFRRTVERSEGIKRLGGSRYRYFGASSFSGNLDHALICLFDPHEAHTAVGARLRAEYLVPKCLRQWGG